MSDGERTRDFGMLALYALRSLLCVLSCAWLHTAAASRLKSPALPIQSEREPLPSKGLSGESRCQESHYVVGLDPNLVRHEHSLV